MIFFRKGIAVLIGSLLIATGINGFLVPFKLLEGGAIGISLIFHYLTGVKVGVTFLLVSIPIFILALFFYRPFFYNGINGMLFSSFVIDLLYPLHVVGEQLMIPSLLAAALGGILIGSGVGIMFCFDITMGGLDLLAQMLSRKLTVNPGVIIFCFDVVIVTIGAMLIVSVQLLLSYTTIVFAAISTILIVSTWGRAKKSNV